MDKRIALLIVGSLRNYERTIDNLLNNLIIPNNCDVFLYTGLNNYSDNLRTVKDNSNECDITDYCQRLRPYLKSHEIIEDNNCDTLFNTNYDGYNLKKINYPKEEFKKNMECCYLNLTCWNIMEKYEKEHNFQYDVVVRTRPDLLIKKEVLLNCIDKNTFHFDRRSDFRDHPESYYCSDYLCYGFRNVMDIYAKSVLTFGLSKKNYVDHSGINISLSKEYQIAMIMQKKKINLKPGILSKKGEHMSDTYNLVIIR